MSNSSKGCKYGVQVGVIALALTLSLCNVTAPLINSIGASFTGVSIAQLQSIYTFTALLAIPAILLGGRLTFAISKKSIVLASQLMIFFGGIIGFFGFRTLWLLYAASMISGCGQSLGMTMLTAIIAQEFKGESVARWSGLGGAVFSISGALAVTLSGKIAANYSWRYSYLIMLSAAVFLAVVALVLPKDAPTRELSGGHVDPRGILRQLRQKQYILFVVLGFAASIAFMAFNANISGFIAEANIGGSSQAGYASAVYLFVGIPAGLLCSGIFKLTKRWYMSACMALAAAGYALCALSGSFVALCIGAGVFGFANGMRVPGHGVWLSGQLAPEVRTFGISLFQAAVSLGSVLSSYVINMFSAQSAQPFRTNYAVCCAIIAVVLIGYILLTFMPDKGSRQTQAEAAER